MTTAAEIIEFWFGPTAEDHVVAERQAELWWGKSAPIDQQIGDRFQAVVDSALNGQLDAWASSPTGRLALVITLDQFTRTIWRDSDRAFSGDEQALKLSLESLQNGQDVKLSPIQRVFLYMPLEHAESLEHQDQSVEMFRALAASAPKAASKIFDGYVDFAVRHQEIVARFGRFPHRNALLGRNSTSEELDFLSRPGSSF